jgi:hypothetical protein
MPNISDWPNDASVCLLSQVLEKGSIPQRYFLSSTACAGILRRADKRGKELPPMLKQALSQCHTDKGGAEIAVNRAPTLTCNHEAPILCAEISPTVTNGPPFSRTGNERVECEALVSYSIQGSMIGRADQNGPQGDGINEEVAFTQNCTDRHSVATITPTLTSNGDCHSGFRDEHGLVAYPINTLTLGGRPDPVNDARMTLGVGDDGDPQFTLQAAHCHAVATQCAVRRLTPIECERLQGFPDGYTNIPWRGKPEAPGGPRYKALGNSWAVPVVTWIGKRINEAVK